MGSEIGLNHYNLCGTPLRIRDAPGSMAANWIAAELSCDDYSLSRLPFAAGDVVIDVGAHVGMVAIWLAIRHPEIRIVALEPDPLNFAHLGENIAANGVANIVALQLAVTADGRPIEIARPPGNSGGTSAYTTIVDGFPRSKVDSVKLDEIFDRFIENRCKLLKMDCEGAEHEILSGSSVLTRVDWFSAEFHINSRLEREGFSNDALAALVAQFLPPERISIKSIRIGE